MGDFEEEKHPRDEAGKFAEGGSAGHTGRAEAGARAAETHEARAAKHRDAAIAHRAAAAKEADPARRSEHLARAAHHEAREADHQVRAAVEREAQGIRDAAPPTVAHFADKHAGGRQHGGVAHWLGEKLEGAREGLEKAGERVQRVEEKTLEEGGALKGLAEAGKLAGAGAAGAVAGAASGLGPGGEHG